VSRRGWVLFAAMSVIWGVPYLLIKVAVGGVAPPVLVLARVAIGAALLLPIAIRRRELGVLRAHWRWLAVFAVVEIIIPWLLLSEAETRLSSSLSGLLIASTPIVAALLAWLTGGALGGAGPRPRGCRAAARKRRGDRRSRLDSRGSSGGGVLRHRPADRRPQAR
jgi:drug/metabolite transporter (DMT)-like permease